MLPLAPVLVALAAVLLVYGFHPLKRWRYRHIPGPRPRWLIGNLIEVFQEGSEKAAARWGVQYGPGPWVFWLGGVPVVMVDDPQLARKLMVRPARHKLFTLHTGDSERFESDFLVFSNGPLWKATRNAWQGFFKQEVVDRNGPLMADSAERLCTHLQAAADSGEAVDVWRELGSMTMDVVGTCAFGVDFATLGTPQGRRLSSVHTRADRLVGAVNTFFELFALGNPLFALFFLFPELEPAIKWLANALPTRNFKRELAARRELQVVGGELLQQAQAAAGGSDDTGSVAAHGSAAAVGSPGHKRPEVVNPGSFLALILPSMGQAHGGTARTPPGVLDEHWAVSQATGFILAGYETTANALAFAVYLLACNPGPEAKLLAEVGAWGRDRVPTAADVASFPYAAAVINEALRLYPPAGTIVREAPEGMELGGLRIPRDAALQVSTYSMHRNPRYWKEPLAFVPERFVPGTPEAAEVLPDAHQPFGMGARKCIGYKFAMQEAVLALVALYQKFTFSLLPGQQPLKVRTTLTMGPAHGVQVTLHRRS